MISVLAANYCAGDWIKLLVQSVRKYSCVVSEIVIVDNASEDGSREWLQTQPDVTVMLNPHNVGHGRALDRGVECVKGQYVLVLDSDSHILRPGWDTELMAIVKDDPQYRLIAAQGNDRKPVHPCVMFFEPRWFLKYRMSFLPRDGYDVGRKLYPDTTFHGGKVFMLPVGYEGAPGKKFYDGSWGDTYYLNGQPTFYHNWYSSRIWGVDKVDARTKEDVAEFNQKVFDNDKCKGLMAWDGLLKIPQSS